MLHLITKVLNLYGIDESNCIVSDNNGVVRITAPLISHVCECPFCNSTDFIKNGHIIKKIKDGTNYLKLFIINLKVQRFKCKKCKNIFYEENTISNKYELLSNNSIIEIMQKLLKANYTYDSIGKDMHLSSQNVIDIFDRYYDYERPSSLPTILSFDEKSSNDKYTKSPYIFIILDFLNHKIFDILPNRHKEKIIKYFMKFPLVERKKVKYVVMDMWDPYREAVNIAFPTALIAADSFHVIKNLNQAVDRVRISVMQKYNNKAEKLEDNSDNYYLLKKYHYFFKMEFDDISDKIIYISKLKVHLSKYKLRETILNIDPRLKEAYEFGSKYREFNKTAHYETADNELEELIELFLNSKETSLQTFGNTLCHWRDEIINSFITVKDIKDDCLYDRRLSNGMIEGYNTTIEQLQFNAKGYSNFWRMRNRIIYVINKDYKIIDDKPIPVKKENRVPKNKKENKNKE